MSWNRLDVKAGWVAVFLLFLLWWLSKLLTLFLHWHGTKDEEEGMAVDTVDKEYSDRFERFHSAARHFRDGLLFLLTAIAIDFAAAGPSGATNALAWIFTSLWILIGLGRYFFKMRRLWEILSFLDLILLVALISNSFAHPAGRAAAI